MKPISQKEYEQLKRNFDIVHVSVKPSSSNSKKLDEECDKFLERMKRIYK